MVRLDVYVKAQLRLIEFDLMLIGLIPITEEIYEEIKVSGVKANESALCSIMEHIK